MTDKDTLLRLISKRFRHPFNYKQIGKALGIKGAERRDLIHTLDALAKEGKLLNVQRGRYSLPQIINTVRAKVSCHRDGYGFAVPDDPKEEDIFLPPHALKNIYDGDIVLVRVTKQRDKKREGEIVKIEERGIKRMLGKVVRVKGRLLLKPLDSKLYWPLVVSEKKGSDLKPSPGGFAVAEILEYPVGGYGIGVIEEIMEGDDYALELKNLILKSGLSESYPVEAAKEAKTIESIQKAKKDKHRKNLTELPFVTIDGEKAKDFDDAVYLSKEKDGYRLFVSIADVSRYVPNGGELNKEALYRGNSYYFPDRAIPMLPEALANDLCSLKPDTERLAFTVEIFYDRKGARRSFDFYLSVIKSKARLTYEQVEESFKDDSLLPAGLNKMLHSMRELTEFLFMERHERGSIDFDLPEPEIIIGIEGKIENIIKARRLSSHRMIEEFMIAANRAVAEWFVKNDIPAIYRVHEKPDGEKIKNLAVFLKHLGYDLKQDVAPGDLQKALREFKNTRYEKLVNSIVLRSMKQARYSSQPLGHFGLSLDDYLHFTSPIRRYADLAVHRNLKEFFINGRVCKDKEELTGELEKISGWVSKRERVAWELEKEIFNFSCAKVMQDKLGEEFSGIISSVTPSGFYVELLDIYVEGFVPVETIGDDYYQYEEAYLRLRGTKRKKIYYIGKEVNVKLVRVDLITKRIEFALSNQRSAS